MILGRLRLLSLFCTVPGKKPQKQLMSRTILVEKFREQSRQSIKLVQDKKIALQGIVWRAGFTNEVELNLYLAHDCPKSQYIFAIMNYSELGFKKISNIYLLDYAQYEFPQLKKMEISDRFPLLQSRYRLDPQQVMIGQQEVLNHLIENEMLKFYDMGAPEISIVLDFIDKSIKQPLDALFWNPKLSAQNGWDGNVRAFRAERSYVLLGLLRMNIQKVIREWIKNIPKIYKNKQLYRKSKQEFVKGVTEFCKLLGGKRYAGGEEPNHIDFYLYSIIKAKDNSRTFRNFLEQQLPQKFIGWYRLMNATCQYNSERITLRRVQ